MQNPDTFTNTDWNERVYTDQQALPRLSTVEATNTFTGVISGEGVLRYTMIYLTEETGHFTGMQTITGSVANRIGTFTVREEGSWQGAHITSTMTVIEGSGTGDLAAITGTARYSHDEGDGRSCAYSFEYALNAS